MPHKKRILHLIQSLDSGGCENMLLRTLPLLTDFEHHIITLKELGELAPQFSVRGIPVTCIHQNNLFNLPSYRRLSKEVLALEPSVIVTYLLHADAVGRLFLRGRTSARVIPFLRTTYNYSRYFLARSFERLTAPLVPRYLANSQAVKKFYSENFHIPAEKITVIENGIDVEIFERAQPNLALRQELGIASQDIVLTCVANLHKNKGHTYLLEAFEYVYSGHKNTHLLIVGDGAEKENLLRQVTPYISRERIHFLGKRSDVPSLLKTSHIFVLPTLFEGMSNALLEAMAAGLAIVTTDIAENREIIKDEENGRLVSPADVQSLRNTLVELLTHEDLRLKMGSQSKERAEHVFSLDHASQKFSRAIHDYV